MPLRMECAPAFDYARASHDTAIVPDDGVELVSPGSAISPSGAKAQARQPQSKATFTFANLALDLRYISERCSDTVDVTSASVSSAPSVELKKLDLRESGHLGESICADLDLEEGQVVTLVLRPPPENPSPKNLKPTKETAKALGVPLESKC